MNWNEYTMIIQIASIIFAFGAALFSYLSWMRLSKTTAFEHEKMLRERVGPTFSNNQLVFDFKNIFIIEYEGWRYRIRNYLPLRKFQGTCVIQCVIHPKYEGEIKEFPNSNEIIQNIGEEVDLFAVDIDKRASDEYQIDFSYSFTNPDEQFDNLSLTISYIGENTSALMLDRY